MAAVKNTFDIKELSISNPKTGNAVDMKGGLVEFTYYESILSNHITASLVVSETGNTIDGKNMLDGLPVRGGEPIRVRMTDKEENELSFIGKENALYVNRVKNGVIDNTKSIVAFDLCTKEYLANEQSRVKKRYSGKISESVKNIIKNVLNSNKPQNIEETSNSYNFIGNLKKPFYTLTWLAAKCIPAGKSYGKSAGFFFYETQEGFQFRSIESLIGPTKGGGSADLKKATKLQYNQLNYTTKEGYDKIISWNLNHNIDLQEKLAVGSYNTRFLFFNPFTFEVKHKDFSLRKEQKGNVESAGTELDFVADEFLEGYTRGLSSVLDVGTLPSGKDGLEQLKRWKNKKDETNDRVIDRTVQANTRYNQLFTISIDVMIECDFNLKAGDMVYCEFPDLSGKNDDINRQTSGLYLIASVCHRMTPSAGRTTMNLIRDSFGTKRGG